MGYGRQEHDNAPSIYGTRFNVDCHIVCRLSLLSATGEIDIVSTSSNSSCALRALLAQTGFLRQFGASDLIPGTATTS
jgi:hypothetical protein